MRGCTLPLLAAAINLLAGTAKSFLAPNAVASAPVLLASGRIRCSNPRPASVHMSSAGDHDRNLTGKVAVVTGASRGIGKGVALALGQQGCTVYVTGRSAGGTTTDKVYDHLRPFLLILSLILHVAREDRYHGKTC